MRSRPPRSSSSSSSSQMWPVAYSPQPRVDGFCCLQPSTLAFSLFAVFFRNRRAVRKEGTAKSRNLWPFSSGPIVSQVSILKQVFVTACPTGLPLGHEPKNRWPPLNERERNSTMIQFFLGSSLSLSRCIGSRIGRSECLPSHRGQVHQVSIAGNRVRIPEISALDPGSQSEEFSSRKDAT